MPLTDWSKRYGSFFHRSRILVTGGAGFIGSHLVEALAGLGAAVVVLDDLSGGSRSNVESFPLADLHIGSILDVELLRRSMRDCRYVFHQAALGSVPRSVEQPRLYHEVNATGTLNVLEAAREAGVKRVMFAASSSAYGNSEQLPKIESMPPLPASPYAANKVAGEALLRAYANSYDLDTVSLRYFNIFGPRQNANSAYAAVIAAFAKAILSGQKPTIYGDGEQSRDFTFVENAIHANLLAARHEIPLNGEVYNVACGQRITVNELALKMAQSLGRPGLTPTHASDRAGDVKHSLADLSLIEQTLGYQSIVSFDEGLEQTMRWYQSAGV
ncbi:MAG: NAD-dependent epimerase/dehydratase family protein [Phycisphaerales bacterium]|jgi:UDP-glucose 4-epimerase|nr:NAD-dependent epimerase/dehydratase family protein [Phycisphaerales bacterium]